MSRKGDVSPAAKAAAFKQALQKRATEQRAARDNPGSQVSLPAAPTEPIRAKRKDGDVFKHLAGRITAPVPLSMQLTLQRIAREQRMSVAELLLAVLTKIITAEAFIVEAAEAYRDRDRTPEERQATELQLKRQQMHAEKMREQRIATLAPKRRAYRSKHNANVADGTARTNNPRRPGGRQKLKTS